MAITDKQATTLIKSTEASLFLFSFFISLIVVSGFSLFNVSTSCPNFFLFFYYHKFIPYFKYVSTIPFPFSDVIFNIAPFTIASCGET